MKKRSLAGLIALFMVIAFLAVSCDNAAGGKKDDDGKKTEQNQNGDGKTDPDQNGDGSKDDGGLNEALAFFKEEFGLEIAEDDVAAIMATMMPHMLIFDGETGEFVLGNGVSLEGNEENGTFTFKDYKVTDENSGKEYFINGTYSLNNEKTTSKTTSKITITGSTNGPVESDYTMSMAFEIDEDGEPQMSMPEFNGTIKIKGKTIDVAKLMELEM